MDALGVHDRSAVLPWFRPACGSRKARVHTPQLLEIPPRMLSEALPMYQRAYALILRTFVGFGDAERILEGDSTSTCVLADRPAI